MDDITGKGGPMKKPRYKIDLVFTVNNKIVAVQNVSTWTIPEITSFIRFQNRCFPEREYRIKRREEK